MGSCFGSGGSESKSTSESKTERQKQELEKAFEVYSKEWGVGPDVFPDSRVTPFSTLQQEAITGAGNYADYFSTPQTAGTPLSGETGTAIKGLLSGETGAKPMGDQDVSDYFGKAIYDPTMKTLREDTLPGIDEDYSGPGFWNAARSHERVDVRQDTADYLTSSRADLEWDVKGRNQAIEESKAGRTLAALPGAMAYGQVPAQEIKNNLEIASKQLGGLGQVFGFGQAEQTQAQMKLQDEIMKFAEENQITDPENLSILLTLLGMNFSQSSSSGSSWGPGLGYAGVTSFLSGVGEGMATPTP